MIERLDKTFWSLAQLIPIVLLFFCYKTIESKVNDRKRTSTLDMNLKFGRYQVFDN